MIPKTPNKNFRSRPSLAFDLTPPDPKSPRVEVLPTTFLLHLPIDPIKEKTTLDSLEDIVPQNFLLDPPPITADKTILEYYHRILEATSPFAKSREKLKITMPLPRKLISLSKENAHLSLNNTGLSRKNTTLRERLGQLEQLVLELKRQAEKNDSRWQKQLWRNDDVDSRHHDQQVINTRFNVDIDHVRTAQVDNHADYVKWRRGQDTLDLLLYRANFVPIFVGVLCARLGYDMKGLDNKGSDPDHCSDRYINAYTLFEPISKAETWRKKTGLRHVHYQELKKVRKLFDERNNVAHQSSAAFARLLTDPVFMDGPDQEFTEPYGELFGYYYNWEDGTDMTLEECVSLTDKELQARLRVTLDGHEVSKKKKGKNLAEDDVRQKKGKK